MMMPRMEFIPWVLLSLFVGVVGGFHVLFCALWGVQRRRTRFLSIVGIIYSAFILAISIGLLKGEVDPIAFLYIAIPLVIYAIACIFALRTERETGPRIAMLKKGALISANTGLAIAVVWTVCGLLSGVEDRLTFEIKPGMTKDQVTKILGEPQDSEEDGRLWEYRIKEMGLSAFMFPFCVEFDDQGKVKESWVQ